MTAIKIGNVDHSVPLPDFSIKQIHAGLLIPDQDSIIRMAREILKWRGEKNPDEV